ncbi:transporter [Rhodanobacter sp. L36]|uniref:transporter n=1 Tax=Rhodanobacter sp. L36 TaxID=1747221 RepID=UPI00131AF1F6|nr:transporter [Rhodanobacter sp. L36]
MDFSRYRVAYRPHLPHTHRHRVARATLALACAFVACPVLADNPGYDRPGYGFAPAVLAAGDVTFEQGLPDWSRDHDGGVSSSLYAADSLLRIGIGGPLELQLGSTPWNSLRQSGAGVNHRSSGRGSSNLGLKLALPSSNKDFSWGLLGNVEFTDGAKDFRNDQRQYLLGAQFNWQASERHSLGAYLEDVRAGHTDSTTVAFSDNVTLSKTLVAYVETALLHSPDQGHGTVAGGGLTWMASPRVQLDAGLDHRLSGNASEWQTNLGVSVYFGR